ncbi:hypothetical protein ACN28S_06690 [Cystobacter fuscus]
MRVAGGFTPAPQRSSDTAPLDVDRSGHMVTALSDGQAPTAGGISSSVPAVARVTADAL